MTTTTSSTSSTSTNGHDPGVTLGTVPVRVMPTRLAATLTVGVDAIARMDVLDAVSTITLTLQDDQRVTRWLLPGALTPPALAAALSAPRKSGQQPARYCATAIVCDPDTGEETLAATGTRLLTSGHTALTLGEARLILDPEATSDLSVLLTTPGRIRLIASALGTDPEVFAAALHARHLLLRWRE